MSLKHNISVLKMLQLELPQNQSTRGRGSRASGGTGKADSITEANRG